MSKPSNDFILALEDALQQADEKVGKRSDYYPKGYRSHWEENVFNSCMEPEFLKMFLNGNGSELPCKAAAVHSSSMLAYNFFHWVSPERKLDFGDVKYDHVAFELKLPCLKGKAKANMDVALYSSEKHKLLLLESKFTEYCHKGKFEISKSYENPKCYFSDGEFWAELVKNLVKTYSDHSDHYYDGIKQLICHAIAVSNVVKGDTTVKMPGVPNMNLEGGVEFAEILYEPNEKYEEEHDAFIDYRTLVGEFLEEMKTKEAPKVPLLNIGPEQKFPGLITYRDIWSKMTKTGIGNALWDYLEKRYVNLMQ